jgi:tRNA(Arg) A34 adenosine deaminase TadA
VQAWEELEPAWREAFALAWEAYAAGTIPVGAVVTRDGAVVARGRNRLFEDGAPPGEVAGSRVAHAELNALAHLGIEDRYPDAVVWSTLEPCPMCIGAIWLATVGAVRYAGSDTYAGAARLIEAQLERIDRARTDPLVVEGPLPGPFGVLGELLHVDFFVRTRPEHRVTETFRRDVPQLVELSERLDLWQYADRPLEEALPHFFDEL